MNYSHIVFLVVVSLIFSLSGCLPLGQLKTHRSTLNRLAYNDELKPREKFDQFAETMVTVLEEATDLNSPYKTYKYLNKFSAQNEAELIKLMTDLDMWQSNLSSGGQVTFGAHLLTKSYTRKLASLVPKVTKMMRENDYKLGTFEKALLFFKLKRMMKRKKG